MSRTPGFDFDTYLKCWELARQRRHLGRFVLIISHFVADAERFDRNLEVRDGRAFVGCSWLQRRRRRYRPRELFCDFLTVRPWRPAPSSRQPTAGVNQPDARFTMIRAGGLAIRILGHQRRILGHQRSNRWVTARHLSRPDRP